MKKALALFVSAAVLLSMLAVSPSSAFAEGTGTPAVSSRYAQLVGITADVGTWNRDFLPGRYSYKLTLGEKEDSVTLTPAKADEAEIVKVSGTEVSSVTVSVDNGKYKYVKMKVYLSGKTTRTYTIKVQRAKSSNNDLASLSVSAGTLEPGFDPAVLEYNVTLEYYTPYVTITAAKADTHSTMWIAGHRTTSRRFWVDGGEEVTVEVDVRSQTKVTKPYFVHITRAKADFASQSDALIDFAKHYIGTHYVSGGKGPDKFDCSGFVYYCLNGVGFDINYMTSHVWPKSKYQTIATLDEMITGDILCFNGHVGIYMGKGMMIDCGTSAGGVSIRSCTSPYWVTNFVCGKRVLPQPTPPEDGGTP